jgi:hypothetical protein
VPAGLGLPTAGLAAARCAGKAGAVGRQGDRMNGS